MRLAEFDYVLPRELIAQYPLHTRDACRLLVVHRRNRRIEHRVFRDITEYLGPKDLLVLNDTKVLPCRLIGSRPSGGKVEVFLLRKKDNLTFEAFIRPGRVRLGERINFFGSGVFAERSGKNEVVFFAGGEKEVWRLGVMPLPPYIKRPAEKTDGRYYQTVYSRKLGAVAAPTAGLHFTAPLLRRISSQGVAIAYLTLHTGCGTFRPVVSEDIRDHVMEKEYFEVPLATRRLITASRKVKSRICAVGTTTCRALESLARGNRSGWTDLFIYPGYEFLSTDMLITNFHLPRTTLFMLVCAFAGEGLMKRAYREAIKKRYRFYSYGDAMLIL